MNASGFLNKIGMYNELSTGSSLNIWISVLLENICLDFCFVRECLFHVVLCLWKGREHMIANVRHNSQCVFVKATC